MSIVDDSSVLETVARATRLREGPSGVAAVLRAVYRAGTPRLQDVAREARLPLPVATAIRRELEKAGLLERKRGLSLTERGREFVEGALGLGIRTNFACPTCAGRGIALPAEMNSLVDRLATIVAAAPPIDVTLDQAPCTPETAILRAVLMLHTGGLEGRRILLLGDDDSVSIAIGLLLRSLGRPDLTRGLTVIDADPRRLSFLQDAGDNEGIPIEVVHHDLRAPLPSSLKRSFDVVETDPPYTIEGARLFLSRGCEALRPSGNGLCFFSFAQWAPAQMLDLQHVFVQLGLSVRAVRTDFNRYTGATILGSIGQMMELVHVGASDHELATWEGPLYTADVNPRSRTYVCTRCGTEVELGKRGGPETIEALKSMGCRVCGGHTFRRRPTSGS